MTIEQGTAEPVPLARAAEKTGESEDDLLRRGATGEIAIAVYAHGWTVDPGEIQPNGKIHRINKPRRLRETFLYLEPGYVRRFTQPSKKLPPTGIFQTAKSGPEGVWVEPKPELDRNDLFVDYEDVQRLIHARDGRPKRNPKHTDHDPELQKEANLQAAHYVDEYGRKPTRNRIAEILASRQTKLSVETIKRRIRRQW